MITQLTGVVWKILPWSLRRKLVRLSQSKFTVSAAAVITNAKGEVLLLNHVLRAYSGWGLPGGFISSGEQLEEGIRREIREETGLELESLRLYSVRIVNTHIEILFAAKGVGTPEVKSREITELGWFTLETLPEQMSSAQKLIIEKVLNEEV